MKKVSILVTGTGTGIGQSIIKGLRLSERNYRIVGTDISIWSAGIYRCDRGYLVPLASDAKYVSVIKGIVKKESIGAIIPGCDPELPVLAEARDEIESETGASVVIGASQVVKICRDKYLTSQFLKENGFLYPRTALQEDAEDLASEIGFPLLIKPRGGSGSRDVKVVFDRGEMKRNLKPGYMVQEYLIPTGWSANKKLTRENLYSAGILKQVDEYSTEVLISKSGEIIGSVTNWRTMKKGYPVRAIVDSYAEIQENAEKVANSLSEMGLVGPCNLQCRVTEKGPIFFEINPRFSGSTAVRCAAGFNGPDVIVRNFLFNEDVEQLKKELSYRKLVEIRWWNELYIDPAVFEKLRKKKTTRFSGKIYEYF